jgi:broad specificity phosphatase PhoE
VDCACAAFFLRIPVSREGAVMDMDTWEDSAPDLLIVAHKGTLRVLENSLSGKRADEPWQTIDTGNWRVVTL